MEFHPAVGEQQLSQKYFWGAHAGVGGGDRRQVEASKATLLWVVDEMERRACGLELDRSLLPDSYDVHVDETPTLLSKLQDALNAILDVFGAKQTRDIPSVSMLHDAAVRRYRSVQSWRPEALNKFREEILRF